MHAVEMALEGIDVRGPEAAELRQPRIELLEGFRFQAVETALRVDGGFNETGVTQHAQVLGDGGLRHAKPALDLSHGLLRGAEEAEDGAAIRLGNDFEGGLHSLYILNLAYTCQGI